MDDVIIKFNNKKRIKILLYWLLLLLVCGVFLYLSVASGTIYLKTLMLFSALSVVMIILIIKSLISIFSKEKDDLIINNKGITIKGTELGKKLGLIEWSDIASLAKEKRYNVDFIFLKLKVPEKYINRRPQSQATLVNDGVPVGSDRLDISFDELEKIINEYYAKYNELKS